jgi:hypothetical protein
MSVLTPARTTNDLRRPAWMLVLTLPAYVAYVVVAVTTLATEADSSSAELTPPELSDLGVSWVALHVLWMTPPVLAAIALVMMARRVGLGQARLVAVLSAVAVVLAAGYLIPQLLAFGAGTATWGDSDLYGIGVVLSLAVGWVGVLPATVMVTIGLAKHGITRKVSWGIAIFTGLYVVLELLTYLPALGSAELAETTGPPPFLLGFVWALLGVRLLARR